MKVFCIFFTTGIVIALLIRFATKPEPETAIPPLPSPYRMHCEKVSEHHGDLWRCANDEAVCYSNFWKYSPLYCLPKTTTITGSRP